MMQVFISNRFNKKLVIGWQIAKQISGLNPPSISNNKNCRLKKSGVFCCNKLKIAVKATIR